MKRGHPATFAIRKRTNAGAQTSGESPVRAWTEASQVLDPPSVSLAVFQKEEGDLGSTRSRLESSVDFPWSTAAQMQAPLLDLTAEVSDLCTKLPSSSSAKANPWAEPVVPCVALSRWDQDTTLVRSLMGDAIATHHEFQDAERWPAASPQGSVVAVAIHQSVAMLKDRLFFMENMALSGSMLDRLEPMLVEGDLKDVTATDGIVLPRAIADVLGVELGDQLHVGLASGTRGEHNYEVIQLRVAAIVALPGRLAARLGRSTWIHREFVRDGVGPAGRANALLVTGDPLTSIAIEPFLLVDQESVPEQDTRLRSTLKLLCGESIPLGSR